MFKCIVLKEPSFTIEQAKAVQFASSCNFDFWQIQAIRLPVNHYVSSIR